MIREGTIIANRYEIVGKVGSGGMADVFQARDQRLNRYVAIKALKAEYSDNTKFVTKFHAEAQAIATINHPNIVNIYDVGQEDGIHFIVMELVDGITLKKYIETRGRLPVKETVEIALQIAYGLEAAHSHNIIHRDIKPQNILITRDGTAKVTDFGIAKAASSNTITANAMGSVHYISPEQARGGYSDEKSDIYSLGVTMYEMLSGRVPFTGENPVSVALAHIQEEPKSLLAIDGTIQRGMNDIVNKCMQKKSELRYKSVEELIAELKQFMVNPDGTYGVLENLYDRQGTIFMTEGELKKLKDASRKNNVNPVENNDETAGQRGKKKEDQDDGDVDPKLEKILVFGSIAVAVIIGIILLYLGGRVIGLWGKSAPKGNEDPKATAEATITPSTEEDYVLPDFADQLKESVTVELDNEQITYTIVEEPSDTIAKGNVIRTNPPAGTAVKKGSSIELIVSSGVEQISVPDVTGDEILDANKTLKKKGFVVVSGGEAYSSQDIGKVAYTKPAAGEKVDKGTKIVIYVSKGEESKFVVVPSLIGLTKAQAKKLLTDNKLVLGQVGKSYSSVEAGHVCVQSVSANTQVNEGTAVNITISLGEEKTYRYIGSVSGGIANPFEYETDEPAKIKMVLTQDGKTKVLVNETLQYSDFPYSLSNIEGSSANEGEVTVYKDGVKVSTYNATFKKIAN